MQGATGNWIILWLELCHLWYSSSFACFAGSGQFMGWGGVIQITLRWDDVTETSGQDTECPCDYSGHHFTQRKILGRDIKCPYAFLSPSWGRMRQGGEGSCFSLIFLGWDGQGRACPWQCLTAFLCSPSLFTNIKISSPKKHLSPPPSNSPMFLCVLMPVTQ